MYGQIAIIKAFLPSIRQSKGTCTYERGFSRYIGPGPGVPRRGLWISVGPHSLSHRRFILIFHIFWRVISTIFSLFIKISLSSDPQNSHVPLCNISLGGPGYGNKTHTVSKHLHYSNMWSVAFYSYVKNTCMNALFWNCKFQTNI